MSLKNFNIFKDPARQEACRAGVSKAVATDLGLSQEDTTKLLDGAPVFTRSLALSVWLQEDAKKRALSEEEIGETLVGSGFWHEFSKRWVQIRTSGKVFDDDEIKSIDTFATDFLKAFIHFQETERIKKEEPSISEEEAAKKAMPVAEKRVEEMKKG